jgi:hypothetical protein
MYFRHQWDTERYTHGMLQLKDVVSSSLLLVQFTDGYCSLTDIMLNQTTVQQ